MEKSGSALSILRSKATVDEAIDEYAAQKKLHKESAMVKFADELVSAQGELLTSDFSKLAALDDRLAPLSKDRAAKISEVGIKLLMQNETSAYWDQQLKDTLSKLENEEKAGFMRIIEETPKENRLGVIKKIIAIREYKLRTQIIKTLIGIPKDDRSMELIENTVSLLARAHQNEKGQVLYYISRFIDEVQKDKRKDAINLATPVLLERHLPKPNLSGVDENVSATASKKPILPFEITIHRSYLIIAIPYLKNELRTPEMLYKLDVIFEGASRAQEIKGYINNLDGKTAEEQREMIQIAYDKAITAL